jgi:histidine triad (HIT) family protein
LTLTPTDDGLILELLEVVKELAQRVVDEHEAAAVLTNFGAYQDSRHLHFHITSGQPLQGPGSLANPGR